MGLTTQFLDSLTEPQLTARIRDLEQRLADLYKRRAGRLIENHSGFGWCVSCGRVMVDCAQGFDTCHICATRSERV